MKSNIVISTENHFPYLGNGIQFNESLFGLNFDADLIQKTSELIWQPNSTLCRSTVKPLPSPFNVISDLAGEMTVHLNGKTGLKTMRNHKPLFHIIFVFDHFIFWVLGFKDTYLSTNVVIHGIHKTICICKWQSRWSGACEARKRFLCIFDGIYIH